MEEADDEEGGDDDHDDHDDEDDHDDDDDDHGDVAKRCGRTASSSSSSCCQGMWAPAVGTGLGFRGRAARGRRLLASKGLARTSPTHPTLGRF